MQAVIIAAGESSRFWPLSNKHKHKSQIQLLGKPLIYWTIKGLVENGIKDIIVVRSPHSTIEKELDEENVRQLADGVNISYKVQEKALGTGNALYQAKDFIKEPFILLWGNKVGSKELVKQIIEEQKKGDFDAVLVGGEVTNPSEYGVARLGGETMIEEIVENPELGKEPSKVGIMGARLLTPNFFEYYEKLSRNHEADLVDATNAYMQDKKIRLLLIEGKGLTLKYPWELFGLMDVLFTPENFKEDKDKSAEIGEHVVIDGPVYIGKNVKIGAHTVIEGPVYIGDNCVIGPSNVLRGPLNLEAGVATGAFMEIKHSIVQQNTHFHSGYLGDSLVGENCRFGAGFISANKRFDRTNVKVKIGEEKIDTGLDAFGCAVGDGAAFGIHSGTMPGVLIGSDSIINPGVQVFENILDKNSEKV